MSTAFIRIALLGLPAALLAQDVNRGVEEYRKNNFSEAESVLRKAVERQNDNAKAHRYLGLTLLEQHKASEAESFLRKAEEMEPGPESKVAMARLYVEQKDYDKAEEALRDADGEEARYVRGLLNFHRGRHEEAVGDLAAYLESHPEYAYAHYYLGMSYNALRRPDKMLTHFEMFLRLKPDAPEARKVRSVLRAVR